MSYNYGPGICGLILSANFLLTAIFRPTGRYIMFYQNEPLTIENEREKIRQKKLRGPIRRVAPWERENSSDLFAFVDK